MVREGRATTWSFTRSCETHSSRAACPSLSASRTARGPGALQPGQLHHEPVLGQEQFQARAARSAPGQSCCQRRGGAILLLVLSPARLEAIAIGRENLIKIQREKNETYGETSLEKAGENTTSHRGAKKNSQKGQRTNKPRTEVDFASTRKCM